MNHKETPFAIIICSKGRPHILTDTVRSLGSQSMGARQILLVVTSPQDVDETAARETGVANLEIIYSEPGSSRQRNTGLEHLLEGTKYVCFFDDDMELHPDYIQNALVFLEEVPGVVALSGRMLRESCGSRAEASEIVAAYQAGEQTFSKNFRDRGKHWVLHGCNMVVRASILGYERFDERLPLYSYLEDYDLSVRLRNYGSVGRFAQSVGVHLKTKVGRSDGRKVGYSQIANNWHFLEKGTSHLPFPQSHLRFASLVLRFLASHALASLKKERRVEEMAFLEGNLLALRDLFSGTCKPEKILEL